MFKPINLSTLCLVYMFRCANVFALCVCMFKSSFCRGVCDLGVCLNANSV